MQTISTVSATRPASGYSPDVMSGAVTAVLKPKNASPENTTVRLSERAKDQYVSENKESAKHSARQTETETAEKGNATDAIAETMEHLQQLLREAQKRLRIAQQQMALAMAEMKSAGSEPQKMAAMMKVQTTQTLVISAQGEILGIHAQINHILQEQQKQAKAGGD